MMQLYVDDHPGRSVLVSWKEIVASGVLVIQFPECSTTAKEIPRYSHKWKQFNPLSRKGYSILCCFPPIPASPMTGSLALHCRSPLLGSLSSHGHPSGLVPQCHRSALQTFRPRRFQDTSGGHPPISRLPTSHRPFATVTNWSDLKFTYLTWSQKMLN